MEFRQDGDNMGSGGNFASGIALGSMMNRRDDDRGTYIWAVIIFAIIFIIAIIALALMVKDRRDVGSGTDVAALLTPLIAAKSMDGDNRKSCEIDHLEVMQKLEHTEDRAETRRIQEEQNRQTQTFMQLGFGLSGQINANEKTNLENFAKLENQLGMQSMALQQILQKHNNEDIIQGVINRLSYSPCFGKC